MYKPTISHLEQYENIVKHDSFNYDVFTTVDTILDNRAPRAVSRVHYDTLDSILYHLDSLHVYAPAGIINGRDVILLFATLGQKERNTTMYNTLKRALQQLHVYISEGAYYLYLETSIKSTSAHYKDVTVYATHERVDGLETHIALAGVEKPQFYTGSAQRARLEALR